MNRIAIIALVILALGLVKDFKRDKGLNRKAKIFHTILLTFLIISYAGSIAQLGTIFRNFDKIVDYYSRDVGVVPGRLNLVLYFLQLCASVVVSILVYQMISRNAKARKRFLTILPAVGILSIFGFYRGWLEGAEELVFSHSVIVAIGIIVMGGLTTVYILVYKSAWMDRFFLFELEDAKRSGPIENKGETLLNTEV